MPCKLLDLKPDKMTAMNVVALVYKNFSADIREI